MTTTFMAVSMLMTSIFFMFIKHPLSFGLTLLMQTTLISIFSGMTNYNYWFSYILFLIMVGGMLILFIYMTSIASNEKFKFSSKLTFLFMVFIASTVLFMIFDQIAFNMSMYTNDLINQDSMSNNTKSMTKFVNLPASSNLFLIIIYLLITLIMVVKITDIKHGPLRQKF
nr:NADH dehydrogenase subunit 6 [Nepiodes costipennis multicarinatus]